MSAKMYYDGMEDHLFSTSDDDYIDDMVMMIQDIYPGNNLEVVAKPLLKKIEHILFGDDLVTQKQLDELVHAIDLCITPAPPSAFDYIIRHAVFKDTIPYGILYKCLGDGDTHATTVALFEMLSSYSLHAKVVIALAAFTVNYGKFRLVAQRYPTNPLAKSIALISEDLNWWLFIVTKIIVDLKELKFPDDDFATNMLEEAHIPMAVYWTIRCIVALTSEIMKITGMSHGASNKKDWELSTFLPKKIDEIFDSLSYQLRTCREYIYAINKEEKEFASSTINEINILYSLFHSLPIFDDNVLFDGSTKRKGGIKALQGKNLLLFISDLNLSNVELGIFIRTYDESQHDSTRLMSQNEVLWVPVVNWGFNLTKEQDKSFKKLQEMMPWYSVSKSTWVKTTAIMFMKREWHFNKNPLLVQWNTQEKLWNPIDLQMFLTWETLNFSFSSLINEESRIEATWGIQLLIGLTTTSLVLDWISESKHICLYGGDDIEWIKKFTKIAKDTAQAAEIQIEMLYVGKSDYGWKVQENNAVIHSNNLSHILPSPNHIRFFWHRLQRIWLSKEKHSKRMENDLAMREIATILSFDGNNQGWVLIGKETLDDEPSKIVKAKSDTILKSLNQYDEWKDCVAEKGFVDALNEHLSEQKTPHQCNRMIFPGIENISGMVFCPECDRPMQKRFVYRCYH